MIQIKQNGKFVEVNVNGVPLAKYIRNLRLEMGVDMLPHLFLEVTEAFPFETSFELIDAEIKVIKGEET